MNKFRRKEIYNIIKNINQLLRNLENNAIENIMQIIEELISLIESILDEEEMCRDNIPENLQSGYRYEDSENACDNLESAIETLEDIEDDATKEDIIDALLSVLNYLNESVM